MFAHAATGYLTTVREDLEAELSDRLAALEGWPVPHDLEPVLWADDADGDDGAPGAAPEVPGKAAPPRPAR